MNTEKAPDNAYNLAELSKNLIAIRLTPGGGDGAIALGSAVASSRFASLQGDEKPRVEIVNAATGRCVAIIYQRAPAAT